jgi:hypothetical protein
MICPKCSTELLLDYTFCPQCGSKLPSQEALSDIDSSVADVTDTEVKAADVNDGELRNVDVNDDVFTNPDDIFLSPSPLAQTMPSSYVSQDASVFVAASAPTTADTIVKETVPVTPYVVSTAAASSVPASSSPASSAATASAAGNVDPNDSKNSSSAEEKKEPVIPKEYKALSTAGIFWYMILVCIPVVGWIILLSFAFGGKNKSKKSLSRAILVYWIIFILLVCLAFIIAFIANRNLLVQIFDQNNWASMRDFISQTFINR